jgi:hypothetical protein
MHNSHDPTSFDDYLGRWSEAMKSQDFSTALSVLEEGLEVALNEKNSESIARFKNLKQYTNYIQKALTEVSGTDFVVPSCFICGKSEADGSILIAGATGAICEECVKICVGVVDTQRRALGREFECSFCGKKQFEVTRIIAGPGVAICNECCDICAEIIAKDTD